MHVTPSSVEPSAVGAARLDAFHHTVNIALAMHGVGAAEPPTRMPRSHYPILTETDFGNRLVHETTTRFRGLYDGLRAEIPRLVARLPHWSHNSADAILRTDDALAARRTLEQLRARMMGTLNEGEMKLVARFYAERIGVESRRQLGRQLRAGLGVDIPVGEGNVNELIHDFATSNAADIMSIPAHLHQQVADLTTRAFTQRMSESTFAAELERRFEISEAKARGLARNELGRLNGQITAARHMALGIDAYYWRTRLDERVRPVHRKREGRLYRYDDPPPEGGLPGEDINCRCVEEPDLSKIMAAIRAARQFPGRYSAPLGGTLSGRR